MPDGGEGAGSLWPCSAGGTARWAPGHRTRARAQNAPQGLVSETATGAFGSENLLTTVASAAAKWSCPWTKGSGRATPPASVPTTTSVLSRTTRRSWPRAGQTSHPRLLDGCRSASRWEVSKHSCSARRQLPAGPRLGES